MELPSGIRNLYCVYLLVVMGVVLPSVLSMPVVSDSTGGIF